MYHLSGKKKKSITALERYVNYKVYVIHYYVTIQNNLIYVT